MHKNIKIKIYFRSCNYFHTDETHICVHTLEKCIELLFLVQQQQQQKKRRKKKNQTSLCQSMGVWYVVQSDRANGRYIRTADLNYCGLCS